MKIHKRILNLILALVFVVCASVLPIEAASKTIIEQRLAEIVKIYPQDSTFDEFILTDSGVAYGGCGGLVAFATKKIFHNTYYNNSPDYKKIGSASTTNATQMQNLFKKAKVGDVICWSRPSLTGSHLAIFLRDSSNGIYIYEANFGGPNQVWYNHFWPWGGMDDWPDGGATTVEVYRSKNYNKVNKGTAAQKIEVGQVLEFKYENNDEFSGKYSKENMKFKVLDNSINNPLAVVTYHTLESNYGAEKKTPKSFSCEDGEIISVWNAYFDHYELYLDQYFKVVTPEELAPKKVKNVTVKNKTKGALTVSWKKTKDTTGYQIFRSTEKNGTYTKIKKIKGSATTFTDKTVKKGTKYYYKVRAYKTIAKTTFNGKFSAVVSKKVKK